MVINVVSSKNKIKSVVINRKIKNSGWLASKEQVVNMEKIEKIIQKHGKLINIFYFKNNNYIYKKILKILKINNLI